MMRADDLVRSMRCKSLICVACGGHQLYPLGAGGSAIERSLFALRAAQRDGWRPTSNGPVCSTVCAMALAKNVTPSRVASIAA